MRLDGTVALVTGAASGLGAATADALAARGARVLGLDLEQAIGGATARPGVQLVAGDVTEADQVRAALAAAAELGELRSVVNCAGIGPSARIVGRQGAHDLALFERVLRVNLLGSFTVMALAAEAMASLEPVDDDGARGVVVNTASIAAYDGQIGQAAYAASKGGIVSLTLPAARDLARHGIRVNTIAPGTVDTPLLATVAPEVRAELEAGVPFPSRLARPEEFAQLVVDLIEHDYLNGETVRMDGALRMAPR